MRRSLTVMLTVLTSLSVCYGRNLRGLCQASDIPFSLPRENMGVVAGSLRFGSTTDAAGATITLINHTNKPISKVFILAELLDAHDSYLMAIPYVAGVAGQADEVRFPFPIPNRIPLEAPIAPGDEFRLVGGVQATTSRCPVRARASVIDLKFSDGTEFHAAAAHWQLPASVRTATPLELESVPKALPFQALLVLGVDAQGRVYDVSVRPADPGLSDWFRTQLAGWSFSPEVRDGMPVSTQVNLLFRLHSVFDVNDPHQFGEGVFGLSDRVIAVDVYPKTESDERNQAVSVAGEIMVTPRTQ